MGVVCIKTDFGENIHMDAAYYGMTPELLNNLYALLYQKAAYEITKEVTGDGIVWARAAWAGCQRYPLHWGGDSASTWFSKRRVAFRTFGVCFLESRCAGLSQLARFYEFSRF
mgnify:CR=1 FL=1